MKKSSIIFILYIRYGNKKLYEILERETWTRCKGYQTNGEVANLAEDSPRGLESRGGTTEGGWGIARLRGGGINKEGGRAVARRGREAGTREGEKGTTRWRRGAGTTIGKGKGIAKGGGTTIRGWGAGTTRGWRRE